MQKALQGIHSRQGYHYSSSLIQLIIVCAKMALL